MSIVTRQVEKVLKQDEIVSATCSRCGNELNPLPEVSRYSATAQTFPFAGAYIRGILLTVTHKIPMPVEWELCNHCGFELHRWVEAKE